MEKNAEVEILPGCTEIKTACPIWGVRLIRSDAIIRIDLSITIYVAEYQVTGPCSTHVRIFRNFFVGLENAHHIIIQGGTDFSTSSSLVGRKIRLFIPENN